MTDAKELQQVVSAKQALDDVTQFAALSLTSHAFSNFRDYRNWLIADGDKAEHIANVLTLYVFDLCESPPRGEMH